MGPRVERAGDRVRSVSTVGAVGDEAEAPFSLSRYDLFDYLDPVDDQVASSTYTTQDAACGGGDDADDALVGLDWMHVSSIAVGTQNNWIVTLRNLNTVVSLERNGTARRQQLAAIDAENRKLLRRMQNRKAQAEQSPALPSVEQAAAAARARSEAARARAAAARAEAAGVERQRRERVEAALNLKVSHSLPALRA